jgi:hypothetical protein
LGTTLTLYSLISMSGSQAKMTVRLPEIFETFVVSGPETIEATATAVLSVIDALSVVVSFQTSSRIFAETFFVPSPVVSVTAWLATPEDQVGLIQEELPSVS